MEQESEAGKTSKKGRRAWHDGDDPKVAQRTASVRWLRISSIRRLRHANLVRPP
jgi:hypothetical protein